METNASVKESIKVLQFDRKELIDLFNTCGGSSMVLKGTFLVNTGIPFDAWKEKEFKKFQADSDGKEALSRVWDDLRFYFKFFSIDGKCLLSLEEEKRWKDANSLFTEIDSGKFSFHISGKDVLSWKKEIFGTEPYHWVLRLILTPAYPGAEMGDLIACLSEY
jgi:hypothetical protein